MPGVLRFCSAQSVVTRTSARLIERLLRCAVYPDQRVFVADSPLGASRRMSKYIWQPRQKPKTALSRAAISANALATSPNAVHSAAYPTVAAKAKTNPTPWENRTGAGSSRSEERRVGKECRSERPE